VTYKNLIEYLWNFLTLYDGGPKWWGVDTGPLTGTVSFLCGTVLKTAAVPVVYFNPMWWRRILVPVLRHCQLMVGGEVRQQATYPLTAHPTHRHRHHPRVVRVHPTRRCRRRRQNRRLLRRLPPTPVFGTILYERALVTQSQMGVKAIALKEHRLGTLLASGTKLRYSSCSI
jgi:hypothetical protein